MLDFLQIPTKYTLSEWPGAKNSRFSEQRREQLPEFCELYHRYLNDIFYMSEMSIS